MVSLASRSWLRRRASSVSSASNSQAAGSRRSLRLKLKYCVVARAERAVAVPHIPAWTKKESFMLFLDKGGAEGGHFGLELRFLGLENSQLALGRPQVLGDAIQFFEGSILLAG